MMPLNEAAATTFQRLLLFGQTKIQRSESFMAVHIEEIYTIKCGTIYSIAHYYLQNGDMMADPEMEFIKSSIDGELYPISFRQDNLGMHQYSASFSNGELSDVNVELQKDHAVFANDWLSNIKCQQDL